MTISDLMVLMSQYERCPVCGSDRIGGGLGTFEADTEIGYFKRTCHCGWGIEIKEDSDGTCE